MNTIESLVALTERVEITTILVTNSTISVGSITTIVTIASVSTYLCFVNANILGQNKKDARITSDTARMGGESSANFVGFPNIHFSTARSVLSLCITPFNSVGLN